MTKERKLAIQMWEFIIEHWNEAAAADLKKTFANRHPGIEWENDCWFCEYCRRDYRWHHPGREGIDWRANNCELCPLYKYEIAHGNYPVDEDEDACGCSFDDWNSDPLFSKVLFRGDKEAAEIILRLLKGEKF